MKPKIIEFPDYPEGTTWEGFSVPAITEGEGNPVASLARVKLTFLQRLCDSEETPDTFHYDSTVTAGYGTVIIDNAVTWGFTLNPTILTLVPGTYDWNCLAKDASDRILPLFAGVFKVLPSPTKF